MSAYREQLEEWLKQIEVEAESVLDVGGMAKSVVERVKKWDVSIYKILDNGAESYGHPDYFYDINYLVDLPLEFDIVFCLEVFEYIYNPVQAIENIGAMTKDGGIAYISFPSIYPVHEPKEIDYLRYTKKAIEKLLPMGGFNNWEITPRVATAGLNYLSSFYSSEGMHPARHDPVVFDIGYCVKAYKEGGDECV